jgi:uncharacterized protein YjiS (DUF1127 family)
MTIRLALCRATKRLQRFIANYWGARQLVELDPHMLRDIGVNRLDLIRGRFPSRSPDELDLMTRWNSSDRPF